MEVLTKISHTLIECLRLLAKESRNKIYICLFLHTRLLVIKVISYQWPVEIREITQAETLSCSPLPFLCALQASAFCQLQKQPLRAARLHSLHCLSTNAKVFLRSAMSTVSLQNSQMSKTDRRYACSVLLLFLGSERYE
jgi:hypothetical protein